MIIWRGKGWLLALITFGIAFGVEYGVEYWSGSDNYYQANAWPLYLVGAIAGVCAGIMGYLLNYKHRGTIVNEESGESLKTPSHHLFFIPVEYWALIFPIIFVWGGYSDQLKQEQELIYLQSPQKEDVYFTDFTKVFFDEDTLSEYGIMKVESITSDGVILLVSQTVYNGRSGPEKDIENTKALHRNYYGESMIVLNPEIIQELFNSGAIYTVIR